MKAPSRILSALLTLIALGACSAQTPRVTLNLQRPVDIAFICLLEGAPTQIAECDDGKGQLLGFVVNSERGSLSVFDARQREFRDTDAFIPGITAVPLGGRPAVIVADVDGEYLYITNVWGKSIFRVNSTSLEFSEQTLSGPPVDIVDAGDELLVAVGDQSNLTRVAKSTFGELSELDSIPLPGGSPNDLAVNADGSLAYVAHVRAPWLSVVDLETGAEIHQIEVSSTCGPNPLFDSCEKIEPSQEVALPDANPFDLPQCMNGVDDDGDGQTDFAEDDQCLRATGSSESAKPVPLLAKVSLAPGGKWAYVTNARDRLVVVVNLDDVVRADVNAAGAKGANELYRRLGYKDIVLPVAPIDIVLVDVDADDDEQRLRAYVAGASGDVHVIDVEDSDGDLVHQLRDGNDSDQSSIIQPQLFEGETELALSSNRRRDKPSFGEFSVDKPVDFDDSSAGVTHYGIQLFGNERLELREIWNVTHQGLIVDSQHPVGKVESDGGFSTPLPQFCSSGVEEGDLLIVRFLEDYECGDYRGKSFAWPIETVGQHTLTLSSKGTVYESVSAAQGLTAQEASAQGLLAVGAAIGPLSEDCFGFKRVGRYLDYSVRAPNGVYTVVGSTSGFLHPWQQAADGTCVKDPDADPRFVGRAKEWISSGEPLTFRDCPPSDASVDTLYTGEYFANHAMRFRLIPGCTVDDLTGDTTILPSQPDVSWRFVVNSAFVPKRLSGMGSPQSLRVLPTDKTLYVVDTGQEKLVEIITGSDSIRTTLF